MQKNVVAFQNPLYGELEQISFIVCYRLKKIQILLLPVCMSWVSIMRVIYTLGTKASVIFMISKSAVVVVVTVKSFAVVRSTMQRIL